MYNQLSKICSTWHTDRSIAPKKFTTDSFKIYGFQEEVNTNVIKESVSQLIDNLKKTFSMFFEISRVENSSS